VIAEFLVISGIVGHWSRRADRGGSDTRFPSNRLMFTELFKTQVWQGSFLRRIVCL